MDDKSPPTPSSRRPAAGFGAVNFSPEEMALLVHFANPKQTLSRLGFYAACLTPVALFGIYGFIKEDFIAVTVALVGSLAYLVWGVSSQTDSARTFKSIAEKILQTQESSSEQQ